MSGMMNSASLFQALKRHPNDPDYLGRGVYGGEPFKIHGFVRSARDGRRTIKLHFFKLRVPPPSGGRELNSTR
jgi:hypothetical protein